MTLSSTCHLSSSSGPCVSNLYPNSACLHASLIWRWPENMRGGAITSPYGLYSVQKNTCVWPGVVCVSVQQLHTRAHCRHFSQVPVLIALCHVSLYFLSASFVFSWKVRKWPMCNTSRLSFKPKWCHKYPISGVKSVEGGVKLSSPKSVWLVICQQAVALSEDDSTLPCWFVYLFVLLCSLLIWVYFLSFSSV